VARRDRAALGGDAVTVAPPHFEARDVARRFHAGTRAEVRAVDGVTLSIARGAFAAVTGPSGGGKTTLLALLGALDRPTGGSVLFGGVDLGQVSDAERSRARRRIGFVFQASPMIRGLPVWENVTYPLVPLGVGGAARRERAASLLARVGLPGFLEKTPQELSGGEAQRVGIARALVQDPEAVLADEPTSNLDRRTGDAVADLLREIHARGTTVVVATHDPRLVAAAGVRHEIDGGRLVVDAGAGSGGGGR
jgi:putative ABC transport system ATP-binding protein